VHIDFNIVWDSVKLTSDFKKIVANNLNNEILLCLTENKNICYFFIFNKTNRHTNFPNLFLSRNSTCFGQFLCPSSGVFHCTFGTGICHTGLMTAFEQEHMLLLESCLQTCMTYTSAECTVENS